MRKTSRYWWLHGLIVLGAVAGCRSSNCGCNTCGTNGTVGATPVASGTGYSPSMPPATTNYGGAGGSSYSTGSVPGYSTGTSSGTSSYPGLGSRFNSGAAQQ